MQPFLRVRTELRLSASSLRGDLVRMQATTMATISSGSWYRRMGNQSWGSTTSFTASQLQSRMQVSWRLLSSTLVPKSSSMISLMTTRKSWLKPSKPLSQRDQMLKSRWERLNVLMDRRIRITPIAAMVAAAVLVPRIVFHLPSQSHLWSAPRRSRSNQRRQQSGYQALALSSQGLIKRSLSRTALKLKKLSSRSMQLSPRRDCQNSQALLPLILATSLLHQRTLWIPTRLLRVPPTCLSLTTLLWPIWLTKPLSLPR